MVFFQVCYVLLRQTEQRREPNGDAIESGGTILESVAKLWSLTKQRFSSLREGLVFLNIWSLLDTGIRDSFVPKENCGSAK